MDELQAVLAAPATLSLFQGFCEGIYAEEHIRLWCAARDYAAPGKDDAARRAAAAAIVEQFLRPGAEFEVETDSGAKRAVEAALADAGAPLPADLLESVQAKAAKAMLGDHFKRFQKSDAWAAHVAASSEEHAPLPEPPLLEVLLTGAAARGAFAAFLAASLSSELLDFWTEANAYIRLPRGERVFLSLDICSRYIASGAPQELELPFQLREPVQEGASDADAMLLHGVARHVLQEMAADHYPRFLASEQWRDAVHSTPPERLLHAGSRDRHFMRGNADELGALVRAAPLKEGYQFKRGQTMIQQWRRRWCMLSEHLFAYFDDDHSSGAKGVVLLNEILEVMPDLAKGTATPFVWGLRTVNRLFRFQAANERDRARWVAAVEAARAGEMSVVVY